MMNPKLRAYIELARLDKPVGTELLLYPTLWSLWIASNGLVMWQYVVIFTLGALLMRSAGCVINDYADRDFDKQVTRTKGRPLADGRLTSRQALKFFGLLVGLSASLLLFLPINVFYWSFGALALASLYPFMKRVTYLPQFVLGCAFSWAIPMAYVAQTGSTDIYCWLLYIANLAWTVGYDTYYAMTDKADDINAGVKSTARLFGQYDLLIINSLYAVFIGLMGFVFWQKKLDIAFYGLIIPVSLFIVQFFTAKDRQPTHTFWAFKNNAWVGRVIFLLVMFNYFVNNYSSGS